MEELVDNAHSSLKILLPRNFHGRGCIVNSENLDVSVLTLALQVCNGPLIGPDPVSESSCFKFIETEG